MASEEWIDWCTDSLASGAGTEIVSRESMYIDLTESWFDICRLPALKDRGPRRTLGDPPGEKLIDCLLR